VLKDKGVVNVLANEVEDCCKPEGCRDHTLAVLKCIYDVKRDFWFANNATVKVLNETIISGCAMSQGTISCMSQKKKKKSTISCCSSSSSSNLVLVLLIFLSCYDFFFFFQSTYSEKYLDASTAAFSTLNYTNPKKKGVLESIHVIYFNISVHSHLQPVELNYMRGSTKQGVLTEEINSASKQGYFIFVIQ
jgi:hypothetical protein